MRERTNERDRGAVTRRTCPDPPSAADGHGRHHRLRKGLQLPGIDPGPQAREGARALALHQSVSDAVNGASGSATVTSISTGGSCPTTADPTNPRYATVTVRAKITFGIPFIDLGTKTLTATARMLCGL